MKNLFEKREVSKRRKNNLEIPNQNTIKYESSTRRKKKMKILMISLNST